MDERKYISCSEAQKALGVSSQTLRVWDKEGKVRTIRDAGNKRMFNLEDICLLGGSDSLIKQKRKICYARVSSKKQVDDLERQKSFLMSKYPNHELVADIGSGLNWKRKGLKTLVEQAVRGNISEVVVAHRDRLARFGFELLQLFFNATKTNLVVLDSDTHQSPNEELTEDILSIIHVYSCRQMGKRRYVQQESKNSKNTDLPKSDPEVLIV